MPPPSTPLVGKRRPVKEVWVTSPKGDSIILGSPQDRARKKEDRIMPNREFQYSTPNDSFDHNGMSILLNVRSRVMRRVLVPSPHHLGRGFLPLSYLPPQLLKNCLMTAPQCNSMITWTKLTISSST